MKNLENKTKTDKYGRTLRDYERYISLMKRQDTNCQFSEEFEKEYRRLKDELYSR